MKKTSKTDHWNLLFSAFLITAFIVCAYFLVGMISETNADDVIKRSIYISGLFTLFGLLLFYATRVGDGKQVWRFSPSTLIIMVIPAAYILFAFVMAGLPFHKELVSRPEVLYLAGMSLGYGVPYTILSGYELDTSENDKDASDEKDGDKADTEENEDTEEAVNGNEAADDTEETAADVSEDTTSENGDEAESADEESENQEEETANDND